MDDQEIREEGAVEEGAEGAEEAVEETTEEADEVAADEAAAEEAEEVVEEEKAWYRITGLVDVFDEQGNIVSQYPVGSKQELTVSRGTAAVDSGNAEAIGPDDVE